jgi:hypothetical protein
MNLERMSCSVPVARLLYPVPVAGVLLWNICEFDMREIVMSATEI